MGSSASTHAKAASAPSDSSIKKGSEKNQQVGVSGHTYNSSSKEGSSTNFSGTDSKPLKTCNIKQTNMDMEEEKGALEKKYVVVNSTSGFVRDEDPSEVEAVDDSTVDTDVDSLSIHSDSDSDSDDEEDDEYDEEVARILEDARKLKILAHAFLHPEKPVETDPTSFARNYFTTPSAQPQESLEEANERAAILQDAMNLKTLAVQHMHPELPVEQSEDEKMFTSARNYFNRSDAPVQETFEDAEERARILEDAKNLKQCAVDYMHPEVGVKTSDPTVYGRNYFERPSAEDTETIEESEERARIMADLEALKQAARDYLHPEIGVKVTDATVFGRNYFNRPSAPETEDDEYADERAEILEEMAALKKHAVAYMHPEIGVKVTDATVFGRNYFNRPSAPETEDDEYADERARVLAEAAALKKHAVDYTHPEIGVKNVDGTAFARSFYRPDKERIYTEGAISHDHEESASEVDESHGSMFDLEDQEYDFTEMRTQLATFIPIGKPMSVPVANEDEKLNKEDEEGNLSRSPSCVMLFGLEGSA